MATVVGMHSGDQKTNDGDCYQIVEIVDGQQRITTLILLLKALSKALCHSEDPDKKNNAEKLDEILLKRNGSLLLHINHDRSNCFYEYMKNGKLPEPNTAETLSDRELLKAMGECENFVNEWYENDLLVDLYSHLLYKLTFIFHQISDERLVYSVFEVLNSRGLEVSWFDRLKSLLMAVVFESGAGNVDEWIKEVQQLWADIYRVVGLRIGMSTESMRFAATLQLDNPPSKVSGEEDAVNTLLGQSRKVSEVIDTSRWVLKVTEALNELNADNRRNAVTQISQARLVAVAVKLRDDLRDSEEEILQLWEKITFRIYGIHRKDARTAVGHYVRLAWEIWHKKKKLSTKKIMSRLSKIGAGYPCTEENLNRELGKKDAYGDSPTLSAEELRYFFYRYEEHLAKEAGQDFDNDQWNRIWEVSVADSIEHIMPQIKGWNYIHWLGNLTMLPRRLNSSLKDKRPKKKPDEYEYTGLHDARDVAKRIRSDGTWTQKQVLAREKELLKWAAQEWGD